MYDWVKEYESTSHNSRPEDYLAFKKRWEAIFLERLYQYYPQCRGHVTAIEIGTPLSTAFYLNAYEGGSYGLEWSPRHFEEQIMLKYLNARNVAGVRNLHLTGEASFFGGFAGALVSGFVSAFKIMGLVPMLRALFAHEELPVLEPASSISEEAGIVSENLAAAAAEQEKKKNA